MGSSQNLILGEYQWILVVRLPSSRSRMRSQWRVARRSAALLRRAAAPPLPRRETEPCAPAPARRRAVSSGSSRACWRIVGLWRVLDPWA